MCAREKKKVCFNSRRYTEEKPALFLYVGIIQNGSMGLKVSVYNVFSFSSPLWCINTKVQHLHFLKTSGFDLINERGSAPLPG